MRVDRDGFAVNNKLVYILLPPNRWERVKAGHVKWDARLQTFHFTALGTEESEALSFPKEINAPAIRRCSQLVQKKRFERRGRDGKTPTGNSKE